MIEANKICEILQGIDIDSTFDENGWWETSYGVSFGKERLKEILDYIELEKKDIGIKDINGKSIYTDSSIVELAHIGKMSNSWVSKKGIFVFINKYLQYRFIEIGINTDGIEIESMFHKLTSFKIIDTIQENKLGLIK